MAELIGGIHCLPKKMVVSFLGSVFFSLLILSVLRIDKLQKGKVVQQKCGHDLVAIAICERPFDMAEETLVKFKSSIRGLEVEVNCSDLRCRHVCGKNHKLLLINSEFDSQPSLGNEKEDFWGVSL